MKTNLTQRRIKARKSSACGLCKPWRQGWMKTVRDTSGTRNAPNSNSAKLDSDASRPLPPFTKLARGKLSSGKRS
jgi:hypothetical protein